MTQTENDASLYRTTGPKLGRRNFMRATAAAGGAAAVGVGGTKNQISPIGTAQAIPPALVGYGVGVSATWTLYEWAPWESEDTSEDLDQEIWLQETEAHVTTRFSNIQSSHIDNQNILEGAENVAYERGKLAAIEALNDGESEANVDEAAKDAVDDHYSTLL